MMDSINQYEDNLGHARRIYSDVARKCNRLINIFPSNIMASLFKFTQKDYFAATKTNVAMPNSDTSYTVPANHTSVGRVANGSGATTR